MRFVAIEKLAPGDIICVPHYNEYKEPYVPGFFNLYQVVTVEVGNKKIGFELRIGATDIVTSELTPLRIKGGAFVMTPDLDEVTLPDAE